MNFECKQIKTKIWKEKAGLPCKYSALPLLNQSARSGVDVVSWPFPCNAWCSGPCRMLAGSSVSSITSRTMRTTSGPACSWTLRTTRTTSGPTWFWLEPENWRNEKMEMDLPNLSICGRCLRNDRTGLWRRHGLLNHNAGVVVWHPCICQLVRSRSCHCSSNCVMHGDILWKEGKWGMVEKNEKEMNVLPCFCVL